MKITRSTFDKVMFPCYSPMNMVIKQAHGSCVYDTEGTKYIDLTSGIAVNSLGHTPEGVTRVIRKVSKKLIHVSNIFTNEYTLGFASKLTETTGYDRVFFCNSGAEANEAALKLARRVAFDDFSEDKNEIISFVNSFHGRTFFSVTVGGQESYSDGFGPKPGAITHLPFNDIAAFEKAISDKTCGVIVEPIQGEGGILKADDAFLLKLRELCDKHHALLIFDEVQTGVARSGTLYAYEQTSVKPDILTSAKGIAAGLPL
ncbi:MAG: aminotransferase class III-fold pyridoxal phosphate-dependent enzyme, partial [Succinivibrio sp.]